MFDNANSGYIFDLSSRLRRIVHKHLRIQGLSLSLGDGFFLSPSEVHVLQAIGESQGRNVTSLAEVLGVTKSAVSQMLKKLDLKGLIRKAQTGEDERDILVFLSETGEKAFAEHQKFHLKHLSKLRDRLSCFSEEDLAVTSRVLAEIERTVDDRIGELFK